MTTTPERPTVDLERVRLVQVCGWNQVADVHEPLLLEMSPEMAVDDLLAVERHVEDIKKLAGDFQKKYRRG